MSLYQLVVPLGIVTISFMAVTMLFGLRTKILPVKIRTRVHIILAIITLAIALVPSGIVIYTQFF